METFLKSSAASISSITYSGVGLQAGARAARCGAHVPAWLTEAFEKAQRDGHHDLLATALCAELCTDLIEGGVDQLHFYTLNKPALTRDVCHALGVTPEVSLRDVA